MGEPSIPTIKRLFALSGNRCAFPNCEHPVVVEPSGTVTGKMCHIKGNRQGSKRYDAAQQEAERQGFDNLVLMCGFHHDVIDGDDSAYTVEQLRDMKRRHESNVTKTPLISDRMARDALLLMTGAGAMATIGEVARELGGLVNSLAEAFRGRSASKTPEHKINREEERRVAKRNEAIEILRYAPKGQVQYVIGSKQPLGMVPYLASIFVAGGWRGIGEVKMKDGGSVPPFGALIFTLSDRYQIPSARQGIDQVFKTLGFVFVIDNGTETYHPEGENDLRIAVIIGLRA